MNPHWMEDAERVHDGPWIGEDDNGDLWVQTIPHAREGQGRLWVRFNRWRPVHLLNYWLSKRAGCVVWLERGIEVPR